MKSRKLKKIIAGVLSFIAVSSSGVFAMRRSGRPHHYSKPKQKVTQKIQGITYTVTKKDIDKNQVPTTFVQLRSFKRSSQPVTCIIFPDFPFYKDKLTAIEMSVMESEDACNISRDGARVHKSKTDGIEFVFEQRSTRDFDDKFRQMDDNQRDELIDDMMRALSSITGVDFDTVNNVVDILADILPDDFFDDFDE